MSTYFCALVLSVFSLLHALFDHYAEATLFMAWACLWMLIGLHGKIDKLRGAK